MGAAAGFVGLEAELVVAGEHEGADEDEAEEQDEGYYEAEAEDVDGDFFANQF